MYHQVARFLARPRTVCNVKQAMMRHAFFQNASVNTSIAELQLHLLPQFHHGLCTRHQSKCNKILLDVTDTSRSCIGALKQRARNVSNNPTNPEHPVSQTVGIQKLVLPLSAKRPTKKKKPTIADQVEYSKSD